MRRAVFLDRDGVLNRAVVRDGKPYPPASLHEFEILPDVPDALLRLHHAGFLLVVVTNQPDVAKGIQRKDIVEAMHQRLRDGLPLKDIRVCYEIERPDSWCYKPKPGMVLDAARDHHIHLGRSFMVGDRWRDVGCGRAAGCFTIFIDRGYSETLQSMPDVTCDGLREATDIILSHDSDYPHQGEAHAHTI